MINFIIVLYIVVISEKIKINRIHKIINLAFINCRNQLSFKATIMYNCSVAENLLCFKITVNGLNLNTEFKMQTGILIELNIKYKSDLELEIIIARNELSKINVTNKIMYKKSVFGYYFQF